MKKLFVTLFIAAVGFSYAQNSDTTKVRIGGKEFDFILKNKDQLDSLEIEIKKEIDIAMKEMEEELDDLEAEKDSSGREKEIDLEDFSFLAGIGVHSTMIHQGSFNYGPPASHLFLESDPGRSINMDLILFDKYIPLYKHNIGLVGGIGFSWSSLSFKQGFDLEPAKTGDVTATFDSTLSYNQNKLKMTYLKVPLLLQFNFGKDAEKSFHIAMGGYGALRLGKGKNKVDLIRENRDYSYKTKGDFNLNSFDYGLEGMVGFGAYSVKASYGLATIFANETNVEAYPMQIGLIRTF